MPLASPRPPKGAPPIPAVSITRSFLGKLSEVFGKIGGEGLCRVHEMELDERGRLSLVETPDGYDPDGDPY
jgi:hypothetical protein